MWIGKNARRVGRALSVALVLASAGFLPAEAADHSAAPSSVLAMPALEGKPPADWPGRPLAPPPVGRHEPFDLSKPNLSGLYSERWRAVAAAIEAERVILARCRGAFDECPADAARFLAIADGARTKEGRARFGEVNRAVNLAVRYRSDAGRHGADTWASPLATFAAGEGDCEDYAIVKYLALREAGVPAADLRLVVVLDTRSGQQHAVLAARLDERWLVLDNRRFILLEDRDAGGYRPLVAFGQDGGPVLLASEDADGPA
jgi:predicted transglutaminase-like cysteine proteinase